MLLIKSTETAPATGRIEVIDVLRGFALLGIVLVHYSGEFAGWSSVYNSPVAAQSLPTAAADSVVTFLLNLLLVNKTRALFAFLFGVGFYYQLAKSKRSGQAIESRFLRRMIALLGVGVVHAYLLWSGDILRIYAICGLVLLLIYRWSPRRLFVIAVLFSVVAPAAATVLHYYFHFSPLTEAMKTGMYKGYVSTRYTDLWKANWLRDLSVTWDPLAAAGLWLPVLGNFLFGYWAAQTQLFTKLTHQPILLKRCLFISGILGFLCSNSFVRIMAKALHTTEDKIPSAWHNLLALPAAFSVETMAFFLMCSLIFLYQQPSFTRPLSFFRFAGRMTLTSYIFQSLFGVLFFYGIGLHRISHYGSSVAFLIALSFFGCQLFFSYWWLQHFSIGPIERIWRSLAEGKWQRTKQIAVSKVLPD